MIGLKLKHLIENSIGTKELALKLDTTVQNLYGMYKKDSVTTSLIERIATALNKPITIVFEPDQDLINIVQEEEPKYETDLQTKYINCLENNMALQLEIKQLQGKLEQTSNSINKSSTKKTH